MRSMKKLSAVLVAAGLVIAACGSDDDSADGDATPDVTTDVTTDATDDGDTGDDDATTDTTDGTTEGTDAGDVCTEDRKGGELTLTSRGISRRARPGDQHAVVDPDRK